MELSGRSDVYAIEPSHTTIDVSFVSVSSDCLRMRSRHVVADFVPSRLTELFERLTGSVVPVDARLP